MVTSSAPGKVYLFGEHAVVYGEPAVPCAINRRATVTVEQRADSHLRIHANDLSLDGFTVEYSGTVDGSPDINVQQSLIDTAMSYIDVAIDEARNALNDSEVGFEVTIESDLPLGAGLGSSAAVVVATIDAATRECGLSLPAPDLAQRGYSVEHMVQDGQASRADTFCSATGGAVRVENTDCRSLDAPDLPFVIGYDGGAGDTGVLVSQVRELRETYSFAADTITSIGDLVRQGEQTLEASDPKMETIGNLMNYNHGLLSALGVSSRSLDAMVWAARDAGALGAKLTGAGGGGCIVALDPADRVETALGFTQECAEVFRAKLDREGVRPE